MFFTVFGMRELFFWGRYEKENAMEYKEFQEKIKKCVQEFMGDNVNVQMKEVIKNNGIILYGLVVLEKECNIAPTIYLESFYKEYKAGKEIGEIVKEIIQICNNEQGVKNLDMNFFEDYKKVKNRIMVKLVNRKKNEELLKQIPYIPFLDLAIIFYYSIMNEYFDNGSILIYKEHLKKWNIDKDEFYQNAYQNTKEKLGCKIMNMAELITGLLNAPIENEEELFLENLRNSMFVMTNKTKFQGACCMLFTDCLNEFAEKIGKNFFILPSSIHELILVPDTGKENKKELCAMVKEVNETQVEPEEVLADHVYYYDKEQKKTSLLLP